MARARLRRAPGAYSQLLGAGDKQIQAELSWELFDDNSAGTARGRLECGGQPPAKIRVPFSADCRFSGSRKCAISGGRSPGSDPRRYFPCTGSNLEIGADLIPDFWHFWPLGIKDLQGQNEGVRCPTISKDQVLEILPDATVLPPAEQGDVT
jgi:hypothetical protein